MTSEPDPQSDVWSDWLLHLRHADDPEYDRAIRVRLEHYADRVLDGARLGCGMTLADIGAGEGLIAFRAIDRIGPSLRVLLADISVPMLRHVEALAIQRDVWRQCVFHQCSAENLKGVDDASVDVVTTRAVLAYVADKSAALREFHRVLKPGGRISIAEPILRDEALAVTALKRIIDSRPLGDQERVMSLLHRWRAAQFPDTIEKISTSPIANYCERDLVRFVQASGFDEIHLELHIDVLPFIATSWETFLGTAPHPWAQPLSVILAEQFTAEERQIFEQVVRQAIEAPRSVTIERIAYLTARKPLA
ncbi:MAG: class I SAM-dependent methyltransferase [Stellaceae bacterium]